MEWFNRLTGLLLFACILILAGCAGLKVSRMVPEVKPAGPSLQQSIEIASVTGGSKGYFGGYEQVDNDMFREVLHEALTNASRFSRVGPNADLKLSVKILHQHQTSESLTVYIGEMDVFYEIRDARTNELLWRDRIASKRGASGFSGSKRTVTARERTVQENLRRFLVALANWDGTAAVPVLLSEERVATTLESYTVGSTRLDEFMRNFESFGNVKDKSELFPGDIEIYRRVWHQTSNQETSAELLFVLVTDDVISERFERRFDSLAFLAFESGVLTERIGPSRGADGLLASVQKAVGKRDYAQILADAEKAAKTIQGYKAGVTIFGEFEKDFGLSKSSRGFKQGAVEIIYSAFSLSTSNKKLRVVYTIDFPLHPKLKNVSLHFENGVLMKIQ
jgi:hypothetical protein